MCEDYGRHFIVYRKDMGGQARHYLTGLPGTLRRKNMGRMGEEVPGSDYQGLQHFLSDSPWGHGPLMAQVAGEAARQLGGRRGGAL